MTVCTLGAVVGWHMWAIAAATARVVSAVNVLIHGRRCADYKYFLQTPVKCFSSHGDLLCFECV